MANEIPDFEKAVGEYLRAADILGVVGRRVVVKQPDGDNRAAPWIVLRQLAARDSERSGIEHHITAMLQLDCYASGPVDPEDADDEGGGAPEAIAIGRRTRKLLKELEGVTTGGIVFSEVLIVGDARIPDPDVAEPARERKILTVRVKGHI